MNWANTFSTNVKKIVLFLVCKALIQVNKAKTPADKQRKCVNNHFTNRKCKWPIKISNR